MMQPARPTLLALIPLAVVLLLGKPPAPGAAPASRPASRPATPPPAHAGAGELKSEVPELSAFHEVIFQLWHTAWPNKDVALMKELLPRVKKDFAAVEAATLPGILRDRRPEWGKGLGEMAKAVERYEAAAAGTDTQALLDAVETLHARFEAQSRIVRPHMKELGEYHVGLYQIFHHLNPDKKLPELRAMADTLGLRCGQLAAAETPRWFKGDAGNLKSECATLCERTAELKTAAGGEDWARIDAAVEAVHKQYQKVESLLE